MNVQLQQAITAARAGDKKRAQVLLARVIKDEPDNVQAWFLLARLAESEEQQISFLRKAVAIDPAFAAARQRLAELVADEAPAEATPKEQPELSNVQPSNLQPSAQESIETTVEPPAPGERTSAIKQEPATADAEEIVAPGPQLPVSEDPVDYLGQAEAKTIPPWLAGEETHLASADAPPAAAEMEANVAGMAEPAELPSWLQQEPGEDWLDTSPAEKERVVAQPAGEATPEVAEVREKSESEDKATPAKNRPVEQPPLTGLFWLLVGLAALTALALLYYLITTAISLLF